MDDVPGVSLFQGANINLENALQNQEEAEDLEDQKRRQEEIQNLLTKEMDEFNYDESSVNSSTNISVDEGDQFGYLQKYRDTSMNNQLKVLYEVRVREVKSLTEKLENLETEFNRYKNDAKKQLILLEADKDKINISYKQTQEILVAKTEEITKLHCDIEKLNSVIVELQIEIKNLKDDNTAFHITNQELLQKLSIAEEGITSNKMSDRHLFEQNQAELLKVHSSLDSALSKLDRKDIECKEMAQKLRELAREKQDLIVEKSAIINKLTLHLDNAQKQSQDLLEVIEKLSLENQTLKKSAANKSADESAKVLGLLEKSEFMKELQKEVEKSQEALKKQKIDFDQLNVTHCELQHQYETQKSDLTKYQEQFEILTQERNTLRENLELQSNELKVLKRKNKELSYIEGERNAYDKRVRELEKILMEIKDKSFHEAGMQVSGILGDKEELEKMEKDLNFAYNEIENLKIKLTDAHSEIDSLHTQISLAKERDKLLKALQEKAAHFEKVILEKQTKPECVTIGINTDYVPDNTEILMAKYEAEAIQKEIDLRVNIKKEFDSKFEQMHKEFNKNLNSKETNVECTECNKLRLQLKQYDLILIKLKEELKKNKISRQEDRESIAKLLDVWQEKFYMLENQNQDLSNKYLKVKNYCDDLIKQIKKREEEEKKLLEMIKKEAEVAVKYWNQQALSHIIAATKATQSRINKVEKKFDVYSKQADKEIESIENEFQKKKKILESKIKALV